MKSRGREPEVNTVAERRPNNLPAHILSLLIAVTLLISQIVLLIRLDVNGLFGISLLDDSFYYFTIARNAVDGLGLTFDGATPTNGFHPLWMMILLLVWPLGGIKAGLLIGALCGTATVLICHLLVWRASGTPWAGTATALIMAVNPALYVSWLNGLETATAVLCLTLFLLVTGRNRQPLLLGALAGLVVLARTDYILLVLPGLTALFLVQSGEPPARRLRQFALAIAPLGLAAAGWAVWCRVHTGTLLQTSGMAIPFINSLSIMDSSGTTSPLLIWDRLDKLRLFMTAMRGSSGFGWSLLLLALALLLLLRSDGRPWAEREGRAVPGWLLTGLVITTLFHPVIRLHHRIWYHAPFAVTASLVFALALARLGRRHPWHPLRIISAALLVIAVAIPFGTGWHRLATSGARTKDDIFFTLRRIMERKAGPDVVVGASDAGYLGFTLPNRVINLDGVVNGKALEAMRAGRLTDYIRGQGMAWAFLRGIYFTPKVLGPDFEQWLAIGVFPPHPITFRVLQDREQVLERYRLAGKDPVDLTLLENRHHLRHFGGDPSNFYHKNAVYGTGRLAQLTLLLPADQLPAGPDPGYRVMVELALGPGLPKGPRMVDVSWSEEPLATIRVDQQHRRYRFFIPRRLLGTELQWLTFRLPVEPADREEVFRGRAKTLSFRLLRAVGSGGPPPASAAGEHRAVEQR